jgi:cation diffusion facilitator CzcD-associated flavoprotein CzcO
MSTPKRIQRQRCASSTTAKKTGEFYGRLMTGHITMRPDIQKVTQSGVKYLDGTLEDYDVIIYATGYNVDFPFLDTPPVMGDDGLKLYKSVFLPHHPTMAFIGLITPTGSLIPLAEMQARWCMALINGHAHPLPAASVMASKSTSLLDVMALIYLFDCPDYISGLHG